MNLKRLNITHLKKLIASRRAATAVEFALVAPIVLVMVAGVFEMSRAMWIKASMQFAVEETTRYAIVNSSATTTQLSAYALSELGNSGINITGATFTSTLTVSGDVTYVQISGTYNFTVSIPLVPFPDVTLSAKSRVPRST